MYYVHVLHVCLIRHSLALKIVIHAFLGQLISCAITSHPLGCGCWHWHCHCRQVNL